MTRHVVVLADDGTVMSATCRCGFEAVNTDRAVVVDAAERHAFDTAGRIELGKLRPRAVAS